MKQKYYLKAAWQKDYVEVTKKEYLNAEQAAGFRSKFGSNHPATASFSSGQVSGCTYEPSAPKGEQG